MSTDEIKALRTAKSRLKKATKEKDGGRCGSLMHQFVLQMARYCALMAERSEDKDFKRQMEKKSREFGAVAKLFRSLGG